jgi:hypothetical protein
MYDKSTKRQLDHDMSTKDNWTKQQLDKKTTRPKDHSTKTSWTKKVICAI